MCVCVFVCMRVFVCKHVEHYCTLFRSDVVILHSKWCRKVNVDLISNSFQAVVLELQSKTRLDIRTICFALNQ